jgi:hypothetical protein
MTKCLLALSDQNILGSGMERLLASVPDIDLVSLPIKDRTDLIQKIRQVQADVVVIGGNNMVDENFFASLLTSRLGLMIIQIDPVDNQLHIYQHHHMSIRHSSELVELIQSQ